ncbi:hypothetical protein [Chondrinema litorale]|uniref:hypothetical protein n=1 Tax=Chondrinema litorale TaxID=2994555 RepID=UPI002543A6E0|nr:hypothetical protein [Chondrinema litorale]UZR92275.1 hypothetical protein OQ292_10400 [Chondrinema litorale]
MELKDFFLGPLYAGIVILIALLLKRRLTNASTKPYYLPALYMKLFGALVFALIYQFYYGGGDTFDYYNGGSIFWHALLEKPKVAWEMFWLDPREYTAETINYTIRTRFFKSGEEWYLTKIAGFASFLTFNSYLAISFLFAFFVFLGTWKLYQAMLWFYPHLNRAFAIAIFWAPSLIFWGSGLLKDTITLGSLGFLAHGVFGLFTNRKGKPFFIISIYVFANIILGLKPYILYTFLPALLLWGYEKFISKIKNFAIKLLALPVISVFIVVLGYLLISNIAEETQKYNSIDTITQRIGGFHTDHGRRTDASTYHLGEIEYTPLGMLKKLPESVNVTLFRPYLWEVNNIVMLVSAFESLLFLLITIYMLIKAGPFKLLKSLFSNPEVTLCLSFTIILGFVVGFTSMNFGALARFKIPILPFFAMGIFIIQDSGLLKSTSKKKKNKKKRWQQMEPPVYSNQ